MEEAFEESQGPHRAVEPVMIHYKICAFKIKSG
jgi:hypothetical protein